MYYGGGATTADSDQRLPAVVWELSSSAGHCSHVGSAAVWYVAVQTEYELQPVWVCVVQSQLFQINFGVRFTGYICTQYGWWDRGSAQALGHSQMRLDLLRDLHQQHLCIVFQSPVFDVPCSVIRNTHGTYCTCLVFCFLGIIKYWAGGGGGVGVVGRR